jgi:hypothetical protein
MWHHNCNNVVCAVVNYQFWTLNMLLFLPILCLNVEKVHAAGYNWRLFPEIWFQKRIIFLCVLRVLYQSNNRNGTRCISCILRVSEIFLIYLRQRFYLSNSKDWWLHWVYARLLHAAWFSRYNPETDTGTGADSFLIVVKCFCNEISDKRKPETGNQTWLGVCKHWILNRRKPIFMVFKAN